MCGFQSLIVGVDSGVISGVDSGANCRCGFRCGLQVALSLGISWIMAPRHLKEDNVSLEGSERNGLLGCVSANVLQKGHCMK